MCALGPLSITLPTSRRSTANGRNGPKADIAHPLGASETIVVFSSTGAAEGAEIPLVSSKDALVGNYKLVRACRRPYNVCLYLIRNALSVRSVKADLPSLSTVRG
jgi:hypothetical protein